MTPTATRNGKLRPVDRARITGGFWAARQRANGEVAIPAGPAAARVGRQPRQPAHRRRARRRATSRGPVFMDSDVYKWLEAVAWEYGRDPSADLLAAQREVDRGGRRRPAARRLPELGRADRAARSATRTCRGATSTTARAT